MLCKEVAPVFIAAAGKCDATECDLYVVHVIERVDQMIASILTTRDAREWKSWKKALVASERVLKNWRAPKARNLRFGYIRLTPKLRQLVQDLPAFLLLHL